MLPGGTLKSIYQKYQFLCGRIHSIIAKDILRFNLWDFFVFIWQKYCEFHRSFGVFHSLSPWSSACFHLHPNPPLHPERQDDSSGSGPLRVCLCSLLLTIAICTCSLCRQVSPRQVELIVGVIGIITIRTLQLIIFLISNYPYPSPLTLAYLNNWYAGWPFFQTLDHLLLAKLTAAWLKLLLSADISQGAKCPDDSHILTLALRGSQLTLRMQLTGLFRNPFEIQSSYSPLLSLWVYS